MLLVGFLHHRLGSTDLASLGGLVGLLPLLAAFSCCWGWRPSAYREPTASLPSC